MSTPCPSYHRFEWMRTIQSQNGLRDLRVHVLQKPISTGRDFPRTLSERPTFIPPNFLRGSIRKSSPHTQTSSYGTRDRRESFISIVLLERLPGASRHNKSVCLSRVSALVDWRQCKSTRYLLTGGSGGNIKVQGTSRAHKRQPYWVCSEGDSVSVHVKLLFSYSTFDIDHRISECLSFKR